MSYKKIKKGSQRPKQKSRDCVAKNHFQEMITTCLQNETQKQHLFNSLWKSGNYATLERIIKYLQQEPSAVVLENLSKLTFFQPAKKLMGNPAAFVSYILTGSTSLILRHSMYHQDVEQALCLLANEIKIIFSLMKGRNNNNGLGDTTTFEKFVDFEVNTLTQVLQFVVKHKALHWDIIPTPSYLAIYDIATSHVSQNFLPWLANVDHLLVEYYDFKKFNVSMAALPHSRLDLTQSTGTQARTESVLLQADPFKVLDVVCTDSKQRIMQKVLQFIQQHPENMAAFRKAQSELFHPARRFVHHYLRALSFENEHTEQDAARISTSIQAVSYAAPLIIEPVTKQLEQLVSRHDGHL